MAPGNNWAGSSRGTVAQYLINNTADEVRIWNVTTTLAGNIPTSNIASPGAYAAGTLFKNVVTDENGKQVIEYKDKEEKVILKKCRSPQRPVQIIPAGSVLIMSTTISGTCVSYSLLVPWSDWPPPAGY